MKLCRGGQSPRFAPNRTVQAMDSSKARNVVTSPKRTARDPPHPLRLDESA
jgi:hypothetical protein